MTHRPKAESIEGDLVLATGAVLAGLGVAAGAFGAHALKEQLSVAELDIWRTAANYQMYHALGLMVVARLLARNPTRSLRICCWLFIVGIVLFSGSLYLLVISGVEGVGVLTPIGGACFLAGWAALAFAMIAAPRS